MLVEAGWRNPPAVSSSRRLTLQAGSGPVLATVAVAAHRRRERLHWAVAAGGTCEGEPGARTEAFYGAYFRDLDGNKVCVFKMG